MKNLFENTTTLTLDTWCGLESFQYGLSKRKRYIIFLIAAVGAFFLVQDGPVDDVVLKSLFFVIFLLPVTAFMWVLRWSYKRSFRRKIKTDKRYESPMEAFYVFSEEGFDYAIGVNKGSMGYKMLYKAYESNDFFYLYVNALEAYIVSKDGFTSGTPEQFRSLMVGKMGKKFYNKATKKTE